MEWIVAAVLLGVGVVAAIGLALGQRDPSTRAYKPSVAGLFTLGRTAIRPEHHEEPGQKPAGGGPEDRRP